MNARGDSTLRMSHPVDSSSPHVRGTKKAIFKPVPAKTRVLCSEITVQPFDRKAATRKDTKLKVDQYGSRESLSNSRVRRTHNSDDNLDLLELEEINFPISKPVQVRKKTGSRRLHSKT